MQSIEKKKLLMKVSNGGRLTKEEKEKLREALEEVKDREWIRINMKLHQ